MDLAAQVAMDLRVAQLTAEPAVQEVMAAALLLEMAAMAAQLTAATAAREP